MQKIKLYEIFIYGLFVVIFSIVLGVLIASITSFSARAYSETQQYEGWIFDISSENPAASGDAIFFHVLNEVASTLACSAIVLGSLVLIFVKIGRNNETKYSHS